MLIKIIVNLTSLIVVLYFSPGIIVDRWESAIAAAVALTLINAFLKPVILLLTLPFNILSLGMFTLFINSFLFYLVSRIVPGFTIDSFWHSFWGALLFSVVSFFLNLYVNPKNKASFRFIRTDRGADGRTDHGYRDVIDGEIKEDKDKLGGKEK